MKLNNIRLGVAMAKRGLNFSELAEVSNVSRQTLSYINNGKACKADTVQKISKALNVEPEELIDK